MTRHQLFVQIRKAYFQEALNAADTAVKRADILSGCCGPEPKHTVTLAEARQLFVAAGAKARADYSYRKAVAAIDAAIDASESEHYARLDRLGVRA
jgi:hypothetical protein